MKAARAAFRLSHAIVHAVGGLYTLIARFPGLSEAQRQGEVESWAGGMLRIFGVSLEVHGTPVPQGPALLVVNHISWLDILVLHAARHCRFVSKADVRHWPLIGRLATGAGTLYIERESRRDAMRVVHHMADALRAGDVLAVFPEGTTSDGDDVLPFHGNLLQSAIASGAPVQPVALDFIDARQRQRTDRTAFVGDMTLAQSVWRTLTSPPIVAVVRYGSCQSAEGRDRRAWAGDLREAVQALRRQECFRS